MYTFLNQSRIEKSWEKYLKQRQQDEVPLVCFLKESEDIKGRFEII